MAELYGLHDELPDELDEFVDEPVPVGPPGDPETADPDEGDE